MSFNFCPKCGCKLDGEHNFCPNCGYSLNGEQPKAETKTTEPLFEFSEDTAVFAAGFDRQLEEQEKDSKIDGKLKKALSLCLRGMYDKAMQLYNEVLDEDDLNIEALIGIVCTSSENYEKDYPNAERDIKAVIKVAGGINKLKDEDFKNYVTQRETNVEKNVENSTWGVIEERRKTARKLFKEKDHENAFPLCLELAEMDEAEFQHKVGYCYAMGYGVEQNYKEAFKWYKKAAEQGYAIAQNNLGACYYNGDGITQSYMNAVKWYKKAAEQGYAIAQNNLGICYERGQGVTQSYVEAFKWYKRAAEQGDAISQFKLGVYFKNGRGVAQSITEAKRWLQKAADQGHSGAKDALNKL